METKLKILLRNLNNENFICSQILSNKTFRYESEELCLRTEYNARLV
jgi:hypothetical protein